MCLASNTHGSLFSAFVHHSRTLSYTHTPKRHSNVSITIKPLMTHTSHIHMCPLYHRARMHGMAYFAYELTSHS